MTAHTIDWKKAAGKYRKKARLYYNQMGKAFENVNLKEVQVMSGIKRENKLEIERKEGIAREEKLFNENQRLGNLMVKKEAKIVELKAERDNAEETWDNERKMYQAACVERDEARRVAVLNAIGIMDRQDCEEYCKCCEYWDFNQDSCVHPVPCEDNNNYTERLTTTFARETIEKWGPK